MALNAISNWSKKTRILFWIGSTILILLIILAGLSIYLERALPEKLQAQINEKSGGLYRLSFREFRISLWRGAASMQGAVLAVDTAVFRQLPDSAQSASLITARVNRVQLSGFKVLRYVFSKKIALSEIRIDTPRVQIIRMRKETEKEEGGKESLYAQLPEAVQDARIGKLDIRGIDFRTVEKAQLRQGLGYLRRLSVLADDIRLTEEALDDSTRLWSAASLRIYGTGLSYYSPDGLYQYEISQLEAASDKGLLDIDSLHVRPRYPEREFARKLYYKGDRFDVRVAKIRLSGTDLKNLQKENRVLSRLLEIESPQIKVFNDKSRPEIKKIASDNFPALAFQRLPLSLSIDSLLVKEGNVYYREFNPKSRKIGTVSFEALNGTFSNVSNDPIVLKKNAWISSKIQAKFLGAPKLDVEIKWNMLDSAGAFTYAGTLQGVKAGYLNRLLEPIALVRAEEGQIDGVNFRVSANRFGAQVYTKLLYHDLKVAVLNESDGSLEKKGLFSLFVNWVAVKKSNPRKSGEEPVVAQISYEHPQDRSFFNLMWKALFNGFKENLGVPI